MSAPASSAPFCAVFGPVPSRRLGLSLGVDLLPPKTCSLDCVYCECGPTTRLTTRRERFVEPGEVLRQVAERLAELPAPPDFITLAGSGEPCLHLDLGQIIAGLKRLSPAQVAVLTNATLTPDPAVRAELAQADVLVPSLDAVSLPAFRRVNRPAPGLDPKDIIAGLKALRAQFAGPLWLEILLVAGLNDSPEEIAALVSAAREIAPDLVQLNTVARPPALATARPLDTARLEEIAGLFTLPVTVSGPPTRRSPAAAGQLELEVVQMTRRRPCSLPDIAAMAGLEPEKARELVARLESQGRLQARVFGQTTFYRGV